MLSVMQRMRTSCSLRGTKFLIKRWTAWTLKNNARVSYNRARGSQGWRGELEKDEKPFTNFFFLSFPSPGPMLKAITNKHKKKWNWKEKNAGPLIFFSSIVWKSKRCCSIFLTCFWFKALNKPDHHLRFKLVFLSQLWIFSQTEESEKVTVLFSQHTDSFHLQWVLIDFFLTPKSPLSSATPYVNHIFFPPFYQFIFLTALYFGCVEAGWSSTSYQLVSSVACLTSEISRFCD